MVFLQFNGIHGKLHGLEVVHQQRLVVGEEYLKEKEKELSLQPKQPLASKQGQVLGIELLLLLSRSL